MSIVYIVKAHSKKRHYFKIKADKDDIIIIIRYSRRTIL